MADKPSVVRAVHFVNAGHSLGTYSSTCRAAIITDVKDENTVSLCVFHPKGLALYEDVTYDEGKAGGTWHWPERENVPTSSILSAAAKAEIEKSDGKSHKA